MRFLALCLAASMALAGCSRATTSASGGGTPSLVKAFRKSDGSTMFFAGPMNYSGQEGDLALDFTINASGSAPNTVVCNFTFTSGQNSNFKPSSFILKSADVQSAAASEFELFFAEKNKKVYNYRYSCSLVLSDWLTWMSADGHEIKLNEMLFTGGKKHKRHLQEVRDYVVFPLSQR